MLAAGLIVMVLGSYYMWWRLKKRKVLGIAVLGAGGDHELLGQGPWLYDERVVAGRLEAVWHAGALITDAQFAVLSLDLVSYVDLARAVFSRIRDQLIGQQTDGLDQGSRDHPFVTANLDRYAADVRKIGAQAGEEGNARGLGRVTGVKVPVDSGHGGDARCGFL
mgnify:CR=1 FL=1